MTLMVGIVSLLAMLWLSMYQPKEGGWGNFFSIMLLSCAFPVMVVL